MEAERKRNIRSGEGYTHLFPKAEGTNKTIRTNADVTHTVAFIPKVVNETLNHTERLSKILKGTDTYETCKNIWHFVYQHIAYKKDQAGYEQIRSPARAWHDRKSGVDCDCYSVFISSILSNLKIQHDLRITKYHRDYFQHIYPVVVLNGKEIPIDCVTDQFDYEVPYSEKKDYPMDLQYLNGFDGGDLGQLYGKKKAKTPSAAKTKKPSLLQKLSKGKAQKAKAAPNGQKPKKKGFFKKVLNTVNRVNPATVLLRNGVLAAMKLNVKNVAGRLRWSYLTQEQAAGKGIDPQKFQRLVATREKLEKIFYGAGGNPKNLKKAMLAGKGNKDKAVAGLDGVSFSGIEYMNAYTPLPQLLGPDIYRSENVEGMEGFAGLGQLGEPVTLASVGAAMGVLAGIVASLKQIGNIFTNKGEGAKDFDEATNEAAENNQPVANTTPVPEGEAKEAAKEAMNNAGATVTANESRQLPASSGNELVKANYEVEKADNSDNISESSADNSVTETSGAGENAMARQSNYVVNTPATTGTTETKDPPSNETFWDKNKSWLKPVAIGVGGISLLAIGFAVLKPKPTAPKSSSRSLSGIPKPKKKNYKRKPKHKAVTKPKHKHHHRKKTAVALL